MNKILLMALGLIGLNALSAPVDADLYKKAVDIALGQVNLTCEGGNDFSTYRYEFYTSSFSTADLNSEGRQPLLTFKAPYGNGITRVIKITTSADYKNVTGMTREMEQDYQSVTNLGDLQNPNIVTAPATRVTSVFNCK